MKEKDDFELREVNEIIEGDYQESLQKLSAYSKLLEKEGNIFIRFKKNKHVLNLISNLSYYRICSLGEIYPEENILFTLYSILPDESGSENEDNKKGIDKLKERLVDNEDDNNKKSNKLRSKKPKKENILQNSEDKNITNKEKEKQKDKEEEKDSVILLDEVKSSVQMELNKEGSSIGNNYELYKATWKNLYKWLLIFPLIILIGLIYFIYKDSYGFSFAELICFILIVIICITSISGNAKMQSKKRVNFKKENYLLCTIIALSSYIIICTNTNTFEITAYKFLSRYKAFVHILFISLIILCLVLIYLNKKMINFHKRYSKIVESGALLTDRSLN